VRLLIDEALQLRVAELLADAGHDAVHAVAVGMQGARDRTLFERARNEGLWC
jgi:predicted nuclease of predicted toxin-antitoxin system